MKIAIIDIGTQSVKHYIFEIEGSEKKTLFYKRYSDAHLGDNDEITLNAIERNIRLLRDCLARNQEEGVEKLKLLGTDILRKAKSASNFLARVKELTDQDIQVISQDQEAIYLYEGFIAILPDNFRFAALNIGGGSTEVVIGNPGYMDTFVNLPFGVKFLRGRFAKGEEVDWTALDAYLKSVVTIKEKSEKVFVTGILDFISTAGPALGVHFDKMAIPNHPFSLRMQDYQTYINTLRATPISKLKELYPRDPGFCDNLAIGQSVYLEIAKKLSAKTIIPSRNDLTDGVIYQMLY